MIHGCICPAHILIDGETQRGKLLAKEIKQGQKFCLRASPEEILSANNKEKG